MVRAIGELVSTLSEGAYTSAFAPVAIMLAKDVNSRSGARKWK